MPLGWRRPSLLDVIHHHHHVVQVFDLLTLLGILMLYGLPSLSQQYRETVRPRVLPVLLPLTQTALTGSVYRYRACQ